MYFTEREKNAIHTITLAMAAADEQADPREALMMGVVYQKLAINGNTAQILNLDVAMNVIAAMTPEEKHFVCAYMGSMMSIDDDIDPREMFFWGLLTNRCDLPEMTIVAARQYMSNFI